jgi:hypothetical protein
VGDVLEYIVDGTSGLATGSVGGCIVAGTCSLGEPGKGYLLGNRSDVEGMLGVGTLTTRIKDMFMTGGQNPIIIAVPVASSPGVVSGVTKSGSGADLTVAGSPLAAGDYLITIVTAGGLNVATFTLNGGEVQTVPANGILTLGALTVTFADDTFNAGDTYAFTATAPAATITDVMAALEKPLELYDVEFVYITGASDSTAWAAAQAKAEELFNLHRPTYFKMEARLPAADEDVNDWTAALISERSGFAGRWVQVCAQYGTITDSKGISEVRNWAGLQAGKTMAIPVQRAHGRVRDGNISQGTLPAEWNSAVQSTLESAGYLTAKTYAGMSGAYWGDSRTLADSTSDYQYEEVIRVTFKALRLARVAALKSMYDELGDPVVPADMTGAIFLQTNIEVALDVMTKAIPKEMAAYQVVIPPGQDFVNNGVAMELAFIGIPIIRQIKLFANYTYAGSRFDPRLKEG